MTRTVEVLPDLAHLVQRALEITLAEIQLAIAERGRFTLALAGGSTPKPLYEAIATQDLPWDHIHVFWGDERYVPPSHPESNAGMAQAAWLDHVPIPVANIHPIPTGAGDPAVDAAAYEQELRNFFPTAADFPALDLMLLGLGPDGHTASLFPYTEALQVCDRWVAVGNKDGQPRITLTIPLINQAHCTLFLVTGANKRPALQAIFAPEENDLAYPARYIQPEGKLIWLLDQAAGAELEL